VEDEWLVRMDIADTLAEDGWLVEEFGSADAALAFLTCGKSVELLITDIRLPGALTGWDVAESYRKVFPMIGVLYCTGNPLMEKRQVPGSLFLSKPTSIENLRRACKTVLALPRG
jgi:CheY-like chemotaxis protein